MKRFLGSILLFLTTASFAALPPSSQYNVDSIQQSSFTSQIALLENMGLKANDILVVFDDDDTLETTDVFNSNHPQFLGFTAWDKWQSQLINNNPADAQAIAHSMSAYYANENLIFTLVHMVPTETNLSQYINQLEQSGIKVIVETARGSNMRNATESQLHYAQFHFTNLTTNLALDYTPLINGKPGREITMQHGILMVAGQDKGQVLQSVFQHIKAEYPSFQEPKAILFVDDTQQNDDNVYAAFKDSSTSVYTFTDNRMLAYVNNFDAHDQKIATDEWHALQAAITKNMANTILPD